MAMVTCRECGGATSDAAPACPHCGVQSPGGSCTLVIARPTVGLLGMSAEVLVDGQVRGSVAAKKQIEIPVSPGSHSVEVRTSRGRTVTNVSATTGKTVINVKFSNFSNAPKLS
jgi:hypothetical protein